MHYALSFGTSRMKYLSLEHGYFKNSHSFVVKTSQLYLSPYHLLMYKQLFDCFQDFSAVFIYRWLVYKTAVLSL